MSNRMSVVVSTYLPYQIIGPQNFVPLALGGASLAACIVTPVGQETDGADPRNLVEIVEEIVDEHHLFRFVLPSVAQIENLVAFVDAVLARPDGELDRGAG